MKSLTKVLPSTASEARPPRYLSGRRNSSWGDGSEGLDYDTRETAYSSVEDQVQHVHL